MVSSAGILNFGRDCQLRPEVLGGDVRQPLPFDAHGQIVAGRQYGRDIDAERMVVPALDRRLSLIAVPADPIGAPPEQRDRAAGIAPVRVREPDGDLGEALPEIAFGGRSGLPRRLEDLVGVKRASSAQQLIREPGRVRAGQGEVVRDHGLAGVRVRVRQRTPERVAGARVPRPARRVAIPAQRSGSGSASQP